MFLVNRAFQYDLSHPIPTNTFGSGITRLHKYSHISFVSIFHPFNPSVPWPSRDFLLALLTLAKPFFTPFSIFYSFYSFYFLV